MNNRLLLALLTIVALGGHAARAQDSKFAWAQSIGQSTTHINQLLHSDEGLIYGYGAFSGTQVIGGLTMNSNAGANFNVKIEEETGQIVAAIQNPVVGYPVSENEFFQFIPSPGGSNFAVRMVKLNGDLIWSGNFSVNGSAVMNLAQAVRDASGNVYLLAYIRGTTVRYTAAAGGSTLTSAAALDGVYLLRLNAAGRYEWHLELAKGASATAIGISPLAQDEVVSLIKSNGTTVINRTNAQGKIVWSSSFIPTNELDPVKIQSAGDHVYIGGRFNNTIRFTSYSGQSSIQSASKSYDCFMVKLDLSGKVLWAQRFGGIYDEVFNDFMVEHTDAHPDIVRCVGQFRESAVFGDKTLSDEQHGILGAPAFFCEINANGYFKHVQSLSATIRGVNNVSFSRIALHENHVTDKKGIEHAEHEIFIAGRSSGELNFGDGVILKPSTTGEYSFVCKYVIEEDVVVSTSEMDAAPVVVAPNPTEGEFSLSLPEASSGNGDLYTDIYAPDGHLVFSQPYQQRVTIDVPAGLYFIRLRSPEKALYYGKLIVRR